jgi:hypothetical protein
MCTNLAFVPLVYFCYLETANLTLEEIDYLFTGPTRELSSYQGNCIRRGNMQTRASHRASSTGGSTVPFSMDKTDSVAGAVEQYEKV